MEDFNTAFLLVAKSIMIPAKTEATIVVTRTESRLMTTEIPANQNNMDRLFAARSIENFRPHSALLLIVTNFSIKPEMLHKHTIFAVGTKLLSAFVMQRINEKEKAKMMDETNEKKKLEEDS